MSDNRVVFDGKHGALLILLFWMMWANLIPVWLGIVLAFLSLLSVET